jgi:hypothetical protein
VITAAHPARGLRDTKERFQLVCGEKGDDASFEALGRDSQHPFDQRGVLRVAQGGKTEQRMDGRQTGVAGPRPVAALSLKIVEERPDQWCVEVGEVEF